MNQTNQQTVKRQMCIGSLMLHHSRQLLLWERAAVLLLSLPYSLRSWRRLRTAGRRKKLPPAALQSIFSFPFFHLCTLEDTSLGMTSIFAHLMSRDTYCLYSILCFQGCLYRTQIWKTKNLPAEHNCPLPPIIKAPSIIKYLVFLRKMFLAYNLIHCVCRCHLSFFVSLSRNRSL